MIATIATIVGIELKSFSAIVVATIATIAEEWFPYDHNDSEHFFQRSWRSQRSYGNQPQVTSAGSLFNSQTKNISLVTL